MAYLKLSLDHNKETQTILNRLAKLNNPFIFGDNVSLSAAILAAKEEEDAINEKNDLIDLLDAASIKANEKTKKSDEMLSALRTSIGVDKGRNSDEYVFAGGTRQSDVIAQQKATRESKKKAEEEQKLKKD
jgi:hypothetical protein